MPAEAREEKPGRVLVLGGTRAGRLAAEALAAAGFDVLLSLAGATSAPRLPHGVPVRRGGFGGAQGLARFLVAERVRLVVDATHPHAARMGRNARAAAQGLGLPLLRLERAPWRGPWPQVASVADAAALLPPRARVFAALGARGLAGLACRGDLWLTARVMEAPAFSPPPRWRIIRGWPAASVAREAALLRALGAGWLVCRNSGGAEGFAKVAAAEMLGLSVIMIRHPRRPVAERVVHDLHELVREVSSII